MASFVGNIGDNASHIGLSSILKEFFLSYYVEQLEIRLFYKNYQKANKRRFDTDFIEYANQFDLVIIGGGGFLDYWIEGSVTGTTIDLDPKLIESLKTPMFICSVGCMPHKNIPNGNIEKFRKFLDAVEVSDKINIAVRNDGSINSLYSDIGSKYLKSIPEILDNGFFFDVPLKKTLPIDKKIVAINITFDQLDMLSQCRDTINKEVYLKALAITIEYIVKEYNYHIVFVPHIASDLTAISEVFSFLDDFFVRANTTVAPCMQYDEGANYLFSIYKSSALVIGTRFHTNVCSLSMGVPTIGLIALDRVKYIYDSLSADYQYVMLDHDFSEDLIAKVNHVLSPDYSNSRIMKRIQEMKKTSLSVYEKVFKSFGLL